MISQFSERRGGRGWRLVSLLFASFLPVLGAAAPASGLVDDCRYPTDAEAQQAWSPMQGTAPARTATIDGRRVLQLPCLFSSNDVPRASWDRKVNLDLASCRGLEFKVLCRDAAPVSYFSFYLQSGEGWYHTAFFPENNQSWNTITIDKSEMRSEGNPGGWDRIKTIRISAWRGTDQNTEFYLSDIRQAGLLGRDALVAIIRGDWAGQHRPAEARSLKQTADLVAKQFAAAGVGCGMLSDRDITPERLRGVALVVLPHNPVLPDAAAAALAAWLKDGGRLLAFSRVPDPLAPVLSPENSRQLDPSTNNAGGLLALAGGLAPKVWEQAAETRIAAIGSVASFTSYAEAARGIGAITNKPAAALALARAGTLRESALSRAAARDYAAAVTEAEAAATQLEEAYCLAQEPLPGEFRAFWCHSAFGLKGLSWDEAARRLAANGFTAILPNMLWGGAAFYDSHILPVSPEVKTRGDQIQECLAACRKYGLQVHVWKVNWNLGSAAPRAFVEKMRREKRLQADAQGHEQTWLCPSHPLNQKLEIDSMLEVARRYDIDGLHFDYIRYPDSEHCFCDGCRERFSRAVGQKVRWPQDVLANGPLRQRWLDWRRGNITAIVKAVSQQARALKPRLKISAAVFRYWNTDRDGVGQDWKLWCDKGYLDFVCPMDYTPINRQFENMVSRQVAWAGKTPCYPGLGVSASSSKFGADRAIEQILIARRYHTGGFVIFNYGVRESEELLPKLGEGITAKAGRN